MIWVYSSALCIAFSLAVALTPFVRRLALAVGAVDIPDGQRKTHKEPMATMGGAAVAFALFLTMAALRLLFPDIASLPLLNLALPSAAILTLGVWDDVRPIKPRYKLIFQCLAAICFYAAGFRLERILGANLPVVASFLLTIIWLVACANAINLFDGMDGLASGMGVVVSLALLALAGYLGKVELAVASAALAGACAGFLLFNFPPAVIFLGDTGSLFLGMILGVMAIEGSFKSHLAFALIVPVIALGLPIMDTILAVTRRASRRVPLFTPDKDHIHHRLIALGFTHRQALALLYALSVLLASVSLLIAFSGSVLAGLLIVLGGIIIALVARFLGAGELRDFGFFIIGGLGTRRVLAHHRRILKRGVRALERAGDVDTVVSQGVTDLTNLGFDTVKIVWGGRILSEGITPQEEGGDVWRWDTRLSANGKVQGSLMVIKRGGPQTVPPQTPLLVAKYTAALAHALDRVSTGHQQEEASN